MAGGGTLAAVVAALGVGVSFQKAAAGCGALLPSAAGGITGVFGFGMDVGGVLGLPKALLGLDDGGGDPPGLLKELSVDESPLVGAAEAAAGWLIGVAGLSAGDSFGLVDAGTGDPPCRISFSRPIRSGTSADLLLALKVVAPKRLV